MAIDFTHRAACGCQLTFLAPEYRAFRSALAYDCKRHLAMCANDHESPNLVWACRQLIAEAKTALAEWLTRGRGTTGADR